MRWSSLLCLMVACGSPTPTETTQEPAPAELVVDDNAAADAILDRHNALTKQCVLIERATWRMAWDAKTNDGHASVSESRIRYQGRTGVSFTRAQQQTVPAMRFVSFGRTKEGKYWSAGDGGIQIDLPDGVAAPLASAIDPTPLCAYAKRWPTRTVGSSETLLGEPATRVDLSWADGTVTQMWFSDEKGWLLGSKSEVGDTVTETKLHQYTAQEGGVIWPAREVAVTKSGPITVTTEQVLTQFALDPKDYAPIGPQQVAKLLGVELPPEKVEK